LTSNQCLNPSLGENLLRPAPILVELTMVATIDQPGGCARILWLVGVLALGRGGFALSVDMGLCV
jgi:hypothetical protein